MSYLNYIEYLIKISQILVEFLKILCDCGAGLCENMSVCLHVGHKLALGVNSQAVHYGV